MQREDMTDPDSWHNRSGRLEGVAPHEPVAWRRHNGFRSTAMFSYFSQYSEASMKKWMALRGYKYDLLLRNGQIVAVSLKGNG